MPVRSLIQRLPRHLKLNELRVFVAAYEHRSFRKAAAAVNLSQPAVTKAIASLEQTLGVRLFERLASGVEPTPQAASFAPRAMAIFDELRRAAQDLALGERGGRNSLSVGSVPMPAIPFLPIAVGRLLDLNPGLFVSLHEAREAELFDLLRRREIDLAVMRLTIAEPGDDMQVEPLFDERLCVVASQDHPLASRRELSWDELLQQRWVMPPPECAFFDYVLRTLEARRLALPEHWVQSYAIAFQHAMVLHGGMLGFGMRSEHDFAPGKTRFVRLPIDLGADPHPVAAVTLRAREANPFAAQLLRQIRSQTRGVQRRVSLDLDPALADA